jgi:hypothetical protein
MAYIFGDGFDCYATVNDPLAGYWDSGTVSTLTLVAGRFAGSQAVTTSTSGNNLIKSSGVNDAVHHIVCAFRQTTTLSGSTLGMYFQFSDGTTNQCCIVFRQDGVILLTSATPGGTILATYSGAVTAVNTWTAFEFEVVIHPTAGRFRARKNGNPVDDFDSGATLPTRPGTNSYANKITFGMNASGPVHQMDDILWRSDASSVPFAGDIRCYTRMPASDASVQFARSPSPVVVSQTAGSGLTASKTANLGMMSAFTVPFSGTIASGVVQITTGATGNMKAAIYDANRITPLATSNAVVNPVTGANTITFASPLTVTKGTTYHLATDQDTTIVYTTTGSSQWSFTTTYASFPAASPATATAQGPVFTLNLTPTLNADFVNETLQDGTTSYVYDSTVGHADLYNIASIAATPASTVAVITRAFAEKLDAGFRQVTVQVKSGATTVQATPQALSNSFGWIYRTDTVDPATGAAWTPAAVNALQVGPLITG